MTQKWKTELSPPRKIIKMSDKKKKSFNIILQGRCIFYKVEEEREKGRHVDVKVLAKRAIAPVVSLGHLELRTFTKSGL